MIVIKIEYQEILLIFSPVVFFCSDNSVPLDVQVKNSVHDTPPLHYSTSVAPGGILLGALNRLMNSNPDFK